METPCLIESELAKITKDVLNEFGFEGEYDASGGASDGRFFVEKGVKNVIELGSRGKNAHGIDEYVLIEDLKILPEIYEKNFD